MKSIAELNGLGLHVIPCVKGAGSIINGIDILKRYKLHITRRSVGIRREVVNYKWKIDKATGEPTNVPVDAFNHGLDAVRYVALKHLNVHKEARGITRRN
jgi:phage terminase large subunit